jgi:DNA-binding NarL/FixJ family response regulator
VSGVGVLIVDDEPDIRLLLRLTIERADVGLYVAGEAGSGEDALAMCATVRPGIVLLDQMMPGMTGLDVAERILTEWPDQKIVMCSAYLDERIEIAAERLGVRACTSKESLRAIPGLLAQVAAEN